MRSLLSATAMSHRHVTRMLKSGHVTGLFPGRWPRRVCLPQSPFRVALSLVMWMASATPLRNQSVSWWRMETSFSENECLRWSRWWPTGEELQDAFTEAPLSLTYIYGITVWTLDLVHYTRPFVLGNFVLGGYQAGPDGFVRFEVHGNSPNHYYVLLNSSLSLAFGIAAMSSWCFLNDNQ